MPYCILPLVAAILALIALSWISRKYSVQRMDPIVILAVFAVGILFSEGISTCFGELLSPMVFGTHASSVLMGATLIILCLLKGGKESLPGILMGVVVILTTIAIISFKISYYWMSTIAVMATTATLLFWKRDVVRIDMNSVRKGSALACGAILVAAMAAFCLSLMMITSDTGLQVVQTYSRMAVLVGWIVMLSATGAQLIYLVARRASLDDAITLALYLAALELLLSIATEVVLWM